MKSILFIVCVFCALSFLATYTMSRRVAQLEQQMLEVREFNQDADEFNQTILDCFRLLDKRIDQLSEEPLKG